MFKYVYRIFQRTQTTQEGVHPFARAMADFLHECGNRALRPGIVQPFMRGANSKYEEDLKVLTGYVNDST